jgi:hypothetical protein
MASDPDPNLEAFIDGHLRQLPPLRAPSTLAPRVLAAIQARAARPWWRQAWWDWPLSAKAALAALVLAILGVATGGNLFFEQGLQWSSQLLPARVAGWSALSEGALALVNTLSVVWSKLLQPVVLGALLALLLLYLMCLGGGAALARLAPAPLSGERKT